MADSFDPLLIKIQSIADLKAVKDARNEMQLLQNQVPAGTELWKQLEASMKAMDDSMAKVANKTLPETSEASEGLEKQLRALHMGSRLLASQLGETGQVLHAFLLGGTELGAIIGVAVAIKMIADHAREAAEQITALRQETNKLAIDEIIAANDVRLARKKSDEDYLTSLKSTIGEELAEIDKVKQAQDQLFTLQSEGRKKELQEKHDQMDADIDLRAFEENWTEEITKRAHEENRIGLAKKTAAEDQSEDQHKLNRMQEDYDIVRKRYDENVGMPETMRARPEYIAVQDAIKKQELEAAAAALKQKQLEDDNTKTQTKVSELRDKWMILHNLAHRLPQKAGTDFGDFLGALGTSAIWGGLTGDKIKEQQDKADAMQKAADLAAFNNGIQLKNRMAALQTQAAELEKPIKEIEAQMQKDKSLLAPVPGTGTADHPAVTSGQAAIDAFKKQMEEKADQALQASIAAAKLQATKDEQDMLKAIKDAMIHHTPMTPGAKSQMEGEAGLLSNPPKTSTEMEAAVKDAEKRAEAFSKNPPADFQSYLRLTALVGRMLALQDKLTEATGQPDTKLNDLETKLAEIESRLEIKFLDILKYTTTWGPK